MTTVTGSIRILASEELELLAVITDCMEHERWCLLHSRYDHDDQIYADTLRQRRASYECECGNDRSMRARYALGKGLIGRIAEVLRRPREVDTHPLARVQSPSEKPPSPGVIVTGD